MEIREQGKPRIGLARDIARKLLEKSDISNYPILIKEIANHVEGLSIDGREFEDGLSGASLCHNGKIFIAYNKDHSFIRNRFTVAHELGHALLGHLVILSPIDLYSKDYKELEANQFAAELLMPLQMLKQAVKKIKTVDQLAKAFWVSKDAMSWRVIESGIYKLLNSWS